jgi:hypothetical protein
MNMALWQVAAGDGSRDYADVFLNFGVILVGPGSPGDYFKHKETYLDRNHWAYRPFIPIIAEVIKKNDIVVLKRPSGSQWEVIAVGEVLSDYEFQETFSDVDGWDLQHCRRVKWKTPQNRTVISGLRRGTLFSVNNQNAISEIDNVWKQGAPFHSEQVPPPVEEISIDDLIDSIMERGLPSNSAENITHTIWRLRRIARWYSRQEAEVGEHEIRTFLIVPLLTSLGWAEQKLKIEWNNIDIAIFDSPYSAKSAPAALIESKRLGDGLLYAPEQGKNYAQSFPSCRYFVVSDGIRYKLYEKNKEEWQFSSYMNLMSPKRTHPYYKNVKGAVDFFLKLIPNVAI